MPSQTEQEHTAELSGVNWLGIKRNNPLRPTIEVLRLEGQHVTTLKRIGDPTEEELNLAEGLTFLLLAIDGRLRTVIQALAQEDYTVVARNLEISTALLGTPTGKPLIDETMNLCKHDVRNSVQAAELAAESLRTKPFRRGELAGYITDGVANTRNLLGEWGLVVKAIGYDVSLLTPRSLLQEILAIQNFAKCPPAEVMGLGKLSIHPGPLSVMTVNLLGNSIKEAGKRGIQDCHFSWGLRLEKICGEYYLCFWTQDQAGGYDPAMLENGLPKFGRTTRESGLGGTGLRLINNMARILETEYIVTGNIEERGSTPGVYFMFFIPIKKLNSI